MVELQERHSIEQVRNERRLLESLEYLKDVFNSISSVTVVLNETRQVLFASNNFLDMLALPSDNAIMGMRPGEIISCIHSTKSKHGCGTSEFCSYCGAVQSVLDSQRKNRKSTREARITSFLNGNLTSWDLSVTSVPLNYKSSIYFVVTLTDISAEKRKKQLERIFLHDLVNSAGGITGLIDAMGYIENESEKEEVYNLINQTGQSLLEQITSYRHVLSAESGELEVNLTPVNANDIIQESIQVVSNNKSVNGFIQPDALNENLKVKTDSTLLSRVLINMIKNAAEADNDDSSTVIVGTKDLGNKIRFYVKNDKIIPSETQAQIFQRSFSTKGHNRGLGTYSMKLLGENYLKGKVDFVSNETEKTVFFIDLPKSA